MAEALFIETIRRYMEALPPEQNGWLAGARDPVVGGALALLHRKPGHHWTMEELASEVRASRSVLAERFSRFLGEPPLSYLARWRLQLAVRMLQTTREAVLQVASDVGYAQSRIQARVRLHRVNSGGRSPIGLRTGRQQ
jgi:AraC-like DNA-binding protein